MNSDAWKSFPNAPAPGTRICARAEVPTKGVAAFDLDGFPLLLVASAEGLRAYVNACPHQFLPLDYRSANVLSPDGTLLRCSAHDAGFDALSGAGVDGFGQGCALDPVPVRHEGTDLVIGPA
ncbi:Rieske 2Fe-2S domain-containing protein [Hasllibacter sp. MH4015]|uniref:Rieske (2Fe-2S) protein n=1 Tax=Hasllibacter sp. MH4015 TaxID=2854029 RepID=UPI001CD563F3|nr:Rieske 2Fe-2S domain-containing protein [Hasllibacter sp. MH4015]